MRTTELLRLADAIEQVDPARFNMAKWWANDCGCAIGWGHRRGVLPAGLTLAVNLKWETLEPATDDGRTGFDAIAQAFEITRAQALWLFNDEQYWVDGFPVITPADVARRIREVAGE